MNEDNVLLSGEVTAVLTNEETGEVKVFKTKNIVTTAGKNHIADRLSSSPGENVMSHYAIGTGTGTPAVGNTTLGAEIARVTLDSRTDSANVVTYVATFPAGTGTNSAIAEGGVLNAGSGGTLLVRALFGSTINKTASDSLVVTHTLTIA